MFRMLISDRLGADGLRRLDQMSDVTYDVKLGMSKDELLETIAGYEALLVRSGTKVDAAVIAAGSRLKVIGRAGMGVDNIDVAAATSHGVIVMNTPAANSIATAEQTMALMLAVSRHTAAAHDSLRRGQWQRSEYVGTELHGKMLGIIGFGKIGRLVAARAHSFGMEICACDPYVSEEVARDMDVTLVELEELLADSDYITLHAALLPETERMINATTIAQMKDGVILINVARGKLIDEVALGEALRSGKVRAAALDVYSAEPPPPDNPLIGLPNVLHTPHLGASTKEAQRAVAVEIVEQVANALRGADFRNCVNMPFPTGPDFAAIQPYMVLAEKLGSLHAGLAERPIKRIEVEVHGDAVSGLVRAIAAALLKGILAHTHEGPVNYVNAPFLASEQGIAMSETRGQNPIAYPNLISCKVSWDGGRNLLAGMLFGGREPRIVQINEYTLDARPEGDVLIMQNHDVPGVLGQIGTLLAAYKINIGEWRMGRDKPGGRALSVINLDSRPAQSVLEALQGIEEVTSARLFYL